MLLRKRYKHGSVVHGVKTGIPRARRRAAQDGAWRRAHGDEHGDGAVVFDVDVRVDVAGQGKHCVHPFRRRQRHVDS